MGSTVTVSFDGALFEQAVKGSGWTLIDVIKQNRLPHSDNYLAQAIKAGRINLGALNSICGIIGHNPTEFADMSQIRKIDMPCEIRLSRMSVVALFTAIIDRTKEDYIVACRHEMKGLGPKKPHSGKKMTTQSIENEMRADWFANHLVGYLTDPTPAIDQMINSWQQEAANSLNYTGYKKRVGRSPTQIL